MYFKIVLVLYVCQFLNFVSSEKYSNFFTINEDNDKISEICIMEIIRNNIHCGSLITVVAEKNVDSLLKAISNDECYNVVTKTFYSREQFVWNEIVVILMKDIFEFGSRIIDLTDGLIWNTNAKYIIEIPNIQRGKEVAKVLLKHNVFSAVFLDNSQKSGTEIYTYYPFKDRNCAGNHDTVESLGSCKGNVSVFNMFPQNIPDKFDKCTIKVARHEDVPNVILESRNYRFRGKRIPGLEEYILESIGANKGYLIYYIQVDKDAGNGVVLDNGTVTGVLKYLDTEEAHISIGGFVLILNRAKRFDYIWGHNFGSLERFTASIPLNKWKLIYKEFGWLTWIIIGAFYCLFVVVFNVYNVIATFLKDRVLLILKLWGYFYGNISSTLFKKRKIRGILMCWIWFTFFISNFYNTAFYSLTTEHNTKIRQLPKFERSDYKPCISNPIRTFLKFTYNKTWFTTNNALTMCNDRKHSLDIVASRNDLYSIEMKYTYMMMQYKYIDNEGNPKLDVRSFGKMTTVTAMFTTRGFPLKDMIQTATRNMAESGLLQAHLRTIYLKTLKAIYAKRRAFKNLDMDTISVALAMLFCGLLIAFIAFIVEIITKKGYLVFSN